jgi:hypothetical protein
MWLPGERMCGAPYTRWDLSLSLIHTCAYGKDLPSPYVRAQTVKALSGHRSYPLVQRTLASAMAEPRRTSSILGVPSWTVRSCLPLSSGVRVRRSVDDPIVRAS